MSARRAAAVLPALALAASLALAAAHAEPPARMPRVMARPAPAPGATAAAPAEAPVPGMPPMASYRFGVLRRGPAWTPQRTPRTDSIQAGHMANIKAMWEAGALQCAGPFLDGGELRGLFVFSCDSAEAVRLASRDPAIAAGRLVLDLCDWYAPAGIGERYRAMARQPGFRDSMVRVQFGFLDAGPVRGPETPEVQRDQLAHVQRILAGMRDGTLLCAGPLSDPVHRGVFVCAPALDSAAVVRWWADDPHVRSGRLKVVLHPWMFADGTFR